MRHKKKLCVHISTHDPVTWWHIFRNVRSLPRNQIRNKPIIRFLDIYYRRGADDRISRHIRRNLALYNRVVWGVLYHETFPEIKYGFTEEVRTNIRKELEQALQYENSNW